MGKHCLSAPRFIHFSSQVYAPKVSVIIPALNEADSLPHLLPLIPKNVYEIILVDGHSRDETIRIARSFLPTIRVVTQDGKGKGAALRCGARAARGDIVVFLDADGSMDPREIPAFVGALQAGADYVKGSRFLQGGGTGDMPIIRQIGNWGLVTLTNLLFGTHFTDITYGYNACWRRHIDALAFEIDGWACEIVNNIRAAHHGLRVFEIPSYEYRRIAGEAKLKVFSAGCIILKAILRERLTSRTQPPAEQANAPLPLYLFNENVKQMVRDGLELYRHRQEFNGTYKVNLAEFSHLIDETSDDMADGLSSPDFADMWEHYRDAWMRFLGDPDGLPKPDAIRGDGNG